MGEYNANDAPTMKLKSAMSMTASTDRPLRNLWLFEGASGPTIFFRGSTVYCFPACIPSFIAGRPSMDHAFLYAQYLRVSSAFQQGWTEWHSLPRHTLLFVALLELVMLLAHEIVEDIAMSLEVVVRY